MSEHISRRAASVAPFIAMDVLAAANNQEARGERVIHLEVGQPGSAAPTAVLEAARAALQADRLGYVEALGIPPLRERIARHYRERYGLAVRPERVVVTTGSSSGFMLAFLAAFDIGDRVALASPGYPAYRNILGALGLTSRDLLSSAADHFQPTPKLLAVASDHPAGLIVASPSNPTGTMLDAEGLRVLADYCGNAGIRLVSDEIYHGIVYGPREHSMLEFTQSAIVINSFSKYYSMTGWRLGWMIVPEDLVRPIERLAQNLYISAPTLSQLAAIAAFECGEELNGHVRRYQENRDLLLSGLPSAGLDRLTVPDGAFYLYADITHLSNDSRDFCGRMLREAGVAAVPGLDFDPQRGHGTLRISFAGATSDMEEAVRRLRAWKK
jgi:aspartate/methionine/tyrosine aminotransferase